MGWAITPIPGSHSRLYASLVGGFSPTTHLTNMLLVKLGSSSPIFRVKIPKIFELPPPRGMFVNTLPETNSNSSHPTRKPGPKKENHLNQSTMFGCFFWGFREGNDCFKYVKTPFRRCESWIIFLRFLSEDLSDFILSVML